VTTVKPKLVLLCACNHNCAISFITVFQVRYFL